MSSRERFEAWVANVPLHERTPWQVWQARDAEVERLVEALRLARQSMSPVWPLAKQIDALLREYTPKEKRDE